MDETTNVNLEEKFVHREWYTKGQLITLKCAMRNYIHSAEAMTLGENEVYFLATKIQEYEEVLKKLREERREQINKEIPVVISDEGMIVNRPENIFEE